MFAPNASAGGGFNFVSFVTRPTVILRSLALLSAIIVMGVLYDNGEISGFSVYNNNSKCLSFIRGTAVSAFVFSFLLLIIELVNAATSSLKGAASFLSYVDAFISSLYILLWFIAFVWTAHEWSDVDTSGAESKYKNAAQTGIAFAFFSTLFWSGSSYFAVRKGVIEADYGNGQSAEYAGAADPGTAYAAFEGEGY
eukprot:m.45673 g.45673  ORF g.45673 m.45673 type:complete len:196 (-) comp11798_c0_seq1:551-1138(-)